MPQMGPPPGGAQPQQSMPMGQQPPSAFFGGQAPSGLIPPPAAFPPPQPSFPGGGQTLTVQGPPNGIVGLSWTPSVSAVSYRVYQTQSSQPLNLTVTQTIQQPAGQLKNTALITSLTPGITYFVQVRAVDASGLEAATPSSVIVGPSLGR
jgi:hypothetical protein